MTGSCRSRIACSSRLRLMPCGNTRSVGSVPPSIWRTAVAEAVVLVVVALVVERGPSASVSPGTIRAIRASSSASSSAALTGRVPSSSRSAFRARAASSRQAFWRCSSRASRARTSGDRRRGDALGPLQRPAIGDLAGDERRAGRRPGPVARRFGRSPGGLAKRSPGRTLSASCRSPSVDRGPRSDEPPRSEDPPRRPERQPPDCPGRNPGRDRQPVVARVAAVR